MKIPFGHVKSDWEFHKVQYCDNIVAETQQKHPPFIIEGESQLDVSTIGIEFGLEFNTFQCQKITLSW